MCGIGALKYGTDEYSPKVVAVCRGNVLSPRKT